MTAPFGFVVARDLGDGRVEWWESRDGATPLHATAEEARADLARHTGSEQVWQVVALVGADAAARAGVAAGLLVRCRDWIAEQCREDGLDDPDLLREVNAALTDDAREGR